MVLALEIFTRSGGVFASTWAHVLVGIMWIGLLYYFNFVQVPSFAELDAEPGRGPALPCPALHQAARLPRCAF